VCRTATSMYSWEKMASSVRVARESMCVRVGGWVGGQTGTWVGGCVVGCVCVCVCEREKVFVFPTCMHIRAT